MAKSTQINKRLIAKIPTPGNEVTTLGVNSVATANLQDASVTPAKLDSSTINSLLTFHGIFNLGLSTSVAANALTIALKQANGSSDPSTGVNSVKASMRSSTLSNGSYNQRQVTSPLSLVISSGSTLGHSSANAHNIWVYLIDNAGTLELAVSQTLYSENQLVSTVAEGGAGAADSNSAMYSAVARSNVPFRLIGLLVSTQTTAGTWASNMTQVQVGDYGTLSENFDCTFVGNGASSSSVGLSTDLKYASLVDPLNSYSAADGSWTSPKTQKYKVTVAIRVTGTAVVNQYIDSIININGSIVREFVKYVENTAVAGWSAISSWEGIVPAGQKIKGIADTNITSPSLTTSSTHTYMEIMPTK